MLYKEKKVNELLIKDTQRKAHQVDQVAASNMFEDPICSPEKIATQMLSKRGENEQRDVSNSNVESQRQSKLLLDLGKSREYLIQNEDIMVFDGVKNVQIHPEEAIIKVQWMPAKSFVLKNDKLSESILKTESVYMENNKFKPNEITL